MNSVVCITSAGILWGIIAIFISLLKDLGFNSLQCVAIRVFFSALATRVSGHAANVPNERTES